MATTSTHRKLTPGPQTLPKIPQRKNPTHTTNKYTRQNRNSPPNPQIHIQRIRINDRPRRHQTSTKVIRRKQTGRIHRIRQWQIHEDALKQDKRSYREECDTENRDDPVDGRFCGPAEPEHSRR